MKDFAGIELLTKSERRALSMMRFVNHNSIYGRAIKGICDKPDVERFRMLVKELKGQALLNTDPVKEILGIAFHSIIFS